MIVEICCGSFEDALTSYNAGATRIELNSALFLGGLTPSVSALKLTKKNTKLEVISMVRPRAGGFLYSDEEYEVIKEDTKLLMENGSDGIAFGFLTSDFEIDIKRTKEITDIIHKSGKIAVFHRAFDCTKDYKNAIKILIDLGVDRILTSGQQDKAIDGIDVIMDLQKNYSDKIEILIGSGINYKNAKQIIEKTGVSQIHSSCKDYKEDITTTTNNVSYAYLDKSIKYDVVSGELVREILENVK